MFLDEEMTVTTLYDVSPAMEGNRVKLDRHKVPPTLTPPAGYPADKNTHHISNYYPQDVEQPVEIAFYDKNGMSRENFFGNNIQHFSTVIFTLRE